MELNRDMYELSAIVLPPCSMCGEKLKNGYYRLREEVIIDHDIPYTFICEKCYNKLPEGGK